MLTSVLLLLATQLPWFQPPQPAAGLLKVGEAKSGGALLSLDKQVRPDGIDARFEREVTGRRGLRCNGSRAERPSGNFVIVDYRRPGDAGSLNQGVQVWFDEELRTVTVVRKALIARVHQFALTRGHDLTQYRWTVERLPGRLAFTFDAWRDDGQVSDGGAFTVFADDKTGVINPRIDYQVRDLRQSRTKLAATRSCLVEQ